MKRYFILIKKCFKLNANSMLKELLLDQCISAMQTVVSLQHFRCIVSNRKEKLKSLL